jgi:hypothetical protein
MRKAKVIGALAFAVLAAALAPPTLSAAEAGPDPRETIAAFALGCPEGSLPLPALGRADRELRRAFAELGPGKALAMPQRLSIARADELVDELVDAKDAGAEDRVGASGIGAISEADFRRLLAASIVAVPVLGLLDTAYDEETGSFETRLEVDALVFDLRSSPPTRRSVRVASVGYDGTDPDRSAAAALEPIPRLLRLELSALPAFRRGARVLAVSDGAIELELGPGARKGDEYASPRDGQSPGDSSSGSLVAIERVGSDASVGKVLYSGTQLREGASLERVPRLGVDLEPFLHVVLGRAPALAFEEAEGIGAGAVAGIRLSVSRGFLGFRPYAAVQVPAAGVRGYGSAFLFPVDLLVGAEYRAMAGRLSVAPYCGAGLGFVYASETIYAGSESSSDAVVPHIGGHAYLHAAYLASRDIRLFAELGGEYWMSTAAELYADYGGFGFGAGVSIKL